MTEQIAKDIYRIGVTLPNNPLKELNSYLIRSDGENLLIDTGFRCPECFQALERGLEELQVHRDNLDIVCTHLHSDHSGLAPTFAGRDRRIYMSEVDIQVLEANVSRRDFAPRRERYLREGFPEDVLAIVEKIDPSVQYMIERMDHRFSPLKPGDSLTVGSYRLDAIPVPGHTPGNIMLWMEREQIMFTGDHVLFDISPNITHWIGVEDSLGDYLESLRSAKDYPVRLALPGHRKSGDYHQRIETLLAHHQRRLDEVVSLIGERPGINVYELTELMRWKIHARNWAEFPPTQKWFACGETMAHLDYLEKQGVVTHTERRNIRRYHLK